MNRTLVLFTAIIATTVYAMPALAHTFADDPSHVGDIEDPLFELDGRTAGQSTVPAALDVKKAWIDASELDRLTFHIVLRNLGDLTDVDAWRHYYFRFTTEDALPNSQCNRGSGLLASIAPTGPDLLHAGHTFRLVCGDNPRLQSNFQGIQGAWQAGPSGNEVQFTLPRNALGLSLDQGDAALSNLAVETWSGHPVLMVDLNHMIEGPFYPEPLPTADSTDVLAGPVTI